jgi:CheY-like chemotaxis protein
MVHMSPLAEQLLRHTPSAVATESAESPHVPTTWRVLVVEDVPSQQKLLVTVLTKAGHAVTAVDSGRKAVELVEQQTFDLVLMDVQMPGMDGLEATRAIRDQEARLGGHLPIVAVTAHALNGDDEKCRSAGADAYMRKPLNLAEMMALLKQIAGRRVPRV